MHEEKRCCANGAVLERRKVDVLKQKSARCGGFTEDGNEHELTTVIHCFVDRELETEILRQSVGQHTCPALESTRRGTAPRIAAVVSPVTILCRQVSCTRFLLEGDSGTYRGRGGRELPEA